MAKLAPTSIKYVIKATIKAKGIVEQPDVIGAVFGQTEGLLGADLDLRELQRSGRIGRVEVDLKTVDGNSEGQITIPSALDAAETALIAATLETIERVGPCVATITLDGVEDVRFTKRQTLVDKAKDILKSMQESGPPRIEEVSEQIRESMRVDEITSYEGLPAGPGIADNEELIVVEGRADILLLLRYGIRNTVAVEGTSVPQAVVELSKQKTTTVFVDGDRGGELIIREMLTKGQVDFIAQAPPGKEVEDLSRKEAGMALRDRVTPKAWLEHQEKRKRWERTERGEPVPERATPERLASAAPAVERDPVDRTMEAAERSQERGGWERRGRRGERDSRGRGPERRGERSGGRFGDRGEGRSFRRFDDAPREEEPVQLKPAEKQVLKQTLEDLVGTRAACILDERNEILGRVPVTELANALHTVENPHAVVFDGAMNGDIAMAARRKGVRVLVAMEREGAYPGLTVLTKQELE